jgi:hypothetical protein
MADESSPIHLAADRTAPQSATTSQRSRTRLALALAVAGVSDLLGFTWEIFPPLQWVVDIATAFVLFLILGRRWLLLPALLAEAIPGLGVFPVWVLVVLSIAYGNFRSSRNR